MKKYGRFFTAAVCGGIALILAGCGSGGGLGNRGSSKTLKVWLSTDKNTADVLLELENTFNDTVGKAKGYAVSFNKRTSGFETQIAGQLAQGTVDIAEINDKIAKTYIKPGYLLALDPYVENGTIDLSDMTPSAVDRFRLNANTGDVGMPQPLYAVPKDNQPTALFYNATALKALGISIISVEENDLADYNEANGTHYLPHGFYEYAESPASGVQSSTIGGKSAYRVFNDCIPMNWEEQLTLSKYLTKTYNAGATTTYGYYSEWWFNYGWSVGGDCLENGADGSLKFTLCDKNSNYLATKDVTVNGTSYAAGELLSYVDKLYAAEHHTAEIGDGTLYELPSQYDAFSEFCALSQANGKKVNESGVNGYGVSPNPTNLNNMSRASVITTRRAAIVAAELNEAATIKSTMGKSKLEWGIAPFAQYREYNEDGTVKTVNGTEIKGQAVGHNLQAAFAVSSSTKYPDECAEFIGWWTSPEVQKKLLTTGTRISCLNSVNEEPASQETLKSAIGAQNISPILSIARHVNQGDWSYVENGNWITDWANDLNTDVRNGSKTVDAFWAEWEAKTNTYLKQHYTTKKYR